ncbi:hypothetical protein Pmani_031463 [Petrolisthes manimaculis]|uniref:Uncharacterized protein n=1 Tax=Petrolisthes manimaculis TaxID=1843537 RepID=A0AAE1TRY5_9EUCA|nr:hypothetical protein Pmani_031463 [Petrolisthes manimaculis]
MQSGGGGGSIRLTFSLIHRAPVPPALLLHLEPIHHHYQRGSQAAEERERERGGQPPGSDSVLPEPRSVLETDHVLNNLLCISIIAGCQLFELLLELLLEGELTVCMFC